MTRLEFWRTKVSGTHIVEIDADRNIRFVGVLWIDVE